MQLERNRMSDGIFRTMQSTYWKKKVWPPFKSQYPIDAYKVEQEMKGIRRPLPASDFGRGLVEEIREALKVPNPPVVDFGWWDKPSVVLHNARGGVEYQEEQVKYFGNALLDLNSPYPWDDYINRANNAGLRVTYWRHCHSYNDIRSLLSQCKNKGFQSAAINIEDLVTEDITPQGIASVIDQYYPNVSLLIISLGWLQNPLGSWGTNYSPLKRHVFSLEAFLNDPDPNWGAQDDVTLMKAFGEHARDVGLTKVQMLCGIYPAKRYITSSQYLYAIKTAGEMFGGIYLGDNNGSNYSQWAI